MWGFPPPLFYIIIILIFKPKEITSTRKVHIFNQSHSRNEVEDYNTKKHVPAVGMAYGKKNADYIHNQDGVKKNLLRVNFVAYSCPNKLL